MVQFVSFFPSESFSVSYTVAGNPTVFPVSPCGKREGNLRLKSLGKKNLMRKKRTRKVSTVEILKL
jgi:hypothetical protein